MLKIKIIISKLIWKLAGHSPRWGNRVMDILGYDNYCKIARYQKDVKNKDSALIALGLLL
jgi:hypothetical protein